MSHCQFKGSKCEKQLFSWLHITRSSLSYEAALRFRGTMQQDEQLRQRRFAFPGTGQCGGDPTAPPKPSWLYAGGSTQPPRAALLAVSSVLVPARVQFGNSTRLAPAGTEQHPARLGRPAIKAVPSPEQACSHWPLMALLAAARTVSIFLACLQLCSLNTNPLEEGSSPALPLPLGAGCAGEHSLQLCPPSIAPLKYFHGVHLLFDAADEKQFCQDFLVILCQWHPCSDGGSEPGRTQESFRGICLPFGWCTRALSCTSSDVSPQQAAWIFPGIMSWSKLDNEKSLDVHLLPLLLGEKIETFLFKWLAGSIQSAQMLTDAQLHSRLQWAPLHLWASCSISAGHAVNTLLLF